MLSKEERDRIKAARRPAFLERLKLAMVKSRKKKKQVKKTLPPKISLTVPMTPTANFEDFERRSQESHNFEQEFYKQRQKQREEEKEDETAD